MVFPLDGALEELKQRMEDEDEAVVTIAPDDLHKADTSGGEPDEDRRPDLARRGTSQRAAPPTLCRRSRLSCFRFGGFPGYEGIDQGIPLEIEGLHQNLLAF